MDNGAFQISRCNVLSADLNNAWTFCSRQSESGAKIEIVSKHNITI